MTDRATVFYAIDVHRADRIQATYRTTRDDTSYTDLVIGALRLTIHGDHSKTASMLMAAAAECPDGPLSYDGVRDRTLAEDRPTPCSARFRGRHCTLEPGHEGGHNFPVGASPYETPGRDEGTPNLRRVRAPLAEDAVRGVGA